MGRVAQKPHLPGINPLMHADPGKFMNPAIGRQKSKTLILLGFLSDAHSWELGSECNRSSSHRLPRLILFHCSRTSYVFSCNLRVLFLFRFVYGSHLHRKLSGHLITNHSELLSHPHICSKHRHPEHIISFLYILFFHELSRSS